MRRNEIVLAVLVILALLAGLTLDHLVPSHASPSPAPAAAGPPLSEAWYCAVPTSVGLPSTVLSADVGAGAAILRQTGTGLGPSVETPLQAGSVTQAAVAPSPATGPAMEESFGQEVVTALTVISPSAGAATSRCSAQPGTEWLFAQASTNAGYDTYLLVANPFPEAAVITVRVLGTGGDQVPSGLSDVTVPASSQLKIFLGDYLAETPSFGLDVTASRGRVIVGRLMVVAARDGSRGLSLDVGVPQAGTQWIFAGGSAPTNGSEEIEVANPSDHEALVSMLFQTPGGGAPAGATNTTVPAGSQVALPISDAVPAGTQHGTIIQSTNGVPVVAERVTLDGTSSKAYETVFGVPAGGTDWAVPAGSSVGGTDMLGILAVGASNAHFSVSLLGSSGTTSPTSTADQELDAGARASIDLTPYLGGQPAMVVVHASAGLIAVENDVAMPPAYRETMESVGIPLR